MAKAKRGQDSIGGYFRQIFRANRKLVKGRTNDEVWKLWEKDHPGKELTKREKMIAANVKSQERKRLRKRGGRKAAVAAEAGAITAIGVRAANSVRPTLGNLEVAIDDCMTLAKNLDRARLDSVIQHLRRARNLVVHEIGEK